jgi:acetoin utilization deacetylase AcuC-like enzyme
LGGGSHHAFHDYGSGYCVFNDIVVAGEAMIALKNISSYLVIDLDVHQGDGTASLTRNLDHVNTFSMHCQDNFPSVKQQSSWDVPLASGTTDEQYLDILQNCLQKISKDRNNKLHFDMVYFQAGVDVLGTDKLGKRSLTLKGVEERDKMVYEFVYNHSVPIVVTMGGGYAKGQQEFNTIIGAHCNTIKLLKDFDL